jgi:hypothetical protein
MAVIVESKELLETVIAALVAGVGVTTAFSLSIWGAARFIDLNGQERPLAAFGAAAVGILAFAVTMGAIVIGMIVMTSG